MQVNKNAKEKMNRSVDGISRLSLPLLLLCSSYLFSFLLPSQSITIPTTTTTTTLTHTHTHRLAHGARLGERSLHVPSGKNIMLVGRLKPAAICAQITKPAVSSRPCQHSRTKKLRNLPIRHIPGCARSQLAAGHMRPPRAAAAPRAPAWSRKPCPARGAPSGARPAASHASAGARKVGE